MTTPSLRRLIASEYAWIGTAFIVLVAVAYLVLNSTTTFPGRPARHRATRSRKWHVALPSQGPSSQIRHRPCVKSYAPYQLSRSESPGVVLTRQARLPTGARV